MESKTCDARSKGIGQSACPLIAPDKWCIWASLPPRQPQRLQHSAEWRLLLRCYYCCFRRRCLRHCLIQRSEIPDRKDWCLSHWPRTSNHGDRCLPSPHRCQMIADLWPILFNPSITHVRYQQLVTFVPSVTVQLITTTKVFFLFLFNVEKDWKFTWRTGRMLGSPWWRTGKLGRSGRQSGWRTSARWIRDGKDCISYGNERLHWRWRFARIGRRSRISSAWSTGGCRRRMRMRPRWATSVRWSRWRWATVDGRCWVMRMLLLLRCLLLGRPVVVARW